MAALARQERYTARAIKATALLEETRTLLRAWRPGRSAGALVSQAIAEDLLGKATAARTRDVVLAAFARRFLADGDEPAASIRTLLRSRGPGSWFPQLCLLASARSDVVVREAVTVFLPQARARGLEQVSASGFMGFLAAQEAAGRTAKIWSRSVRERVAQHVLHQLSDLGVLGPRAGRGGRRPILAYSPRDRTVGWLACDLRRRGEDSSALVRHPDWLVLQLGEPEVRAALDRLSDRGLWVFQGAGEVVRLTWQVTDWPQAIAQLAKEEFDG